MIYLSKLLNQKVWDAFGHLVGRLDDILVSSTEKQMPPITALVLSHAPEGAHHRCPEPFEPVAEYHAQNRHHQGTPLPGEGARTAPQAARVGPTDCRPGRQTPGARE